MGIVASAIGVEEERRHAEDALRFTRFSVDNAADTMAWVSRDARFIDVNDAFCRSLGYSREELLSMTVHDIDPEYSVEIWPEFWEKLKQSGSLTFESCHRTKEGKVVPVEIMANFLEYNGKEYHCSTARDITERKQAEEELLRARADWENIFQAIGHPTLILDPEHKVIMANRAVAKAVGTTREELQGKKCYEIFHGTDQPPEGCPLEKMSASGHLETIEMEMETLGNWFLVSCTPVFDEKGALRNVIHIATDISERKRLEKILEKERQELKLIIDASPIIIFYKDKEGRFIRVNKTFTEALKMPEEDLMGKTVFDLYSAKIAQGMTDDDHEVLKSVRPKLNIIEQYESASGIRWVQTDKIPICDKNGIPVGLIGFAQDITERKRAEETLWESQELYRSLFKGVPIGLYRTMPGGEILDANPALVEMLGYPDRESLLMVNLADMFVNPVDRKRWEALMEREGVVRDFEAKFRRYDGTVVWIRDTCHAVRHDDGQSPIP